MLNTKKFLVILTHNSVNLQTSYFRFSVIIGCWCHHRSYH